ncbi:MAG: ParB/RepB/Spo0J family partition protein [SAR202 cluster bacterium]|nr:ParB/RepB/Spo0J family partition protein [SAR202 cluster bacterium]|tara:strand:- start:2 stop:946 length:945 start_codon:yes stop_codon:yes gene_type:complete
MAKVKKELELVDPNDILIKYDNPRESFDNEEMDLLVESVKNEGVLTPIWCNAENGKFSLIAGERRLRAAQKGGLKQIPCRIYEVMNEAEIIALQAIENGQRTNLTNEEKLKQYLSMERVGMSLKDMSILGGESKTTIQGILSLRNLDESILYNPDIDKFAKVEMALFDKDEQMVLQKKFTTKDSKGNKLLNARKLHDSRKFFKKLRENEELEDREKKKIRNKAIELMSNEIPVQNIIRTEVYKLQMEKKGEKLKVVNDELIMKYIEESRRFSNVVADIQKHRIIDAPLSLAKDLAYELTKVIASIKELFERMSK